MASTLKPILIAGLKGPPADVADKPEFSAENLQRVLREQFKLLNDDGFDPTPCLLEPTDPSAIDEFIKMLQSKEWAGVSIGFGIRGNLESTPFFEDMVNACIVHVRPKPPKMIFSTRPWTLSERVKRVFSIES